MAARRGRGAVRGLSVFCASLCMSDGHLAHTPVIIVLSGLTVVHSDSCWLPAQWYYTCAAPLPAPGSLLPAHAPAFVGVFWEDKNDMMTTVTGGVGGGGDHGKYDSVKSEKSLGGWRMVLSFFLVFIIPGAPLLFFLGFFFKISSCQCLS